MVIGCEYASRSISNKCRIDEASGTQNVVDSEVLQGAAIGSALNVPKREGTQSTSKLVNKVWHTLGAKPRAFIHPGDGTQSAQRAMTRLVENMMCQPDFEAIHK